MEKQTKTPSTAQTQAECPSCKSKLCSLLLITTDKKTCRLDCRCETWGVLYSFNLGHGSEVKLIAKEDKKGDAKSYTG